MGTRTATVYDQVEDAIVTAITATGTPFKRVDAWGSHLSDAEIAVELEQLVRVAPAAMVMYGGGETNEGYGNDLTEKAVYTVLVIAAGRDRTSASAGDNASSGVYRLMDYVRDKLHNVHGISGIVNPLLWSGNKRFLIPGHLMNVAAYAVMFRADLYFYDGPRPET